MTPATAEHQQTYLKPPSCLYEGGESQMQNMIVSQPVYSTQQFIKHEPCDGFQVFTSGCCQFDNGNSPAPTATSGLNTTFNDVKLEATPAENTDHFFDSDELNKLIAGLTSSNHLQDQCLQTTTAPPVVNHHNYNSTNQWAMTSAADQALPSLHSFVRSIVPNCVT